MKRPIFWLVLFLAIAIGGGLVYALRSRPARETQKVRIAVPVFQSSALVLLAQDQGYFKDEGLEAEFEYRPTGRDCLDLVLKGKADYAVVYETPVVHASLDGHELSILTELHRSERNTAVVVRKNRGISTPADLAGKKVATTPRTNADFLLELVLRSSLVNPDSVERHRMTILDAVKSVVSGEVDAAALWEPYLSQALESDPLELDTLRSSYYSEFSVLATLRKDAPARSPVSDAIIRALESASEFFEQDEKRARGIVDELVRARGSIPSARAWEQIDIHIGLSETLLAMLNEEARWYRHERGLSEATDMRPLLFAENIRRVDSRLVSVE